jgi:hypothetical protein
MEWKSWQYKNLTILVFTFILSLSLGLHKPFHEFLFLAGYTFAFFAGVIFVFTFGAPIAAVILLILAQKLPLLNLLLFAGFGAVLSDFTLFRNFKDGIAEEVEPLYKTVGKSHIKTLLRTKHFRMLDPVVGGLLILTPLPHEIGMRLIGIHKLKNYDFIMVSAVINIVGILFILLLSLIIKL